MIDTDTGALPAVHEKAATFTESPILKITPITDGSINETYEVITEDGAVFILQKMSPIFEPDVMHNLAAVQPELREARVLIPEGLKTVDGDEYVINGGGVWYRALSYIPGRTIHNHVSLDGAHSAGKITGRFHTALAESSYELAVAIKHFHDTPFYMNRIEQVMESHQATEKDAVLRPVAEEILSRYKELNFDVTSLPQRIIHGDLKISNVRFAPEEDTAVALIDMDTLMRASVAVEMGDALRSWCGTAGEDDANQVFDVEVYKAAMRGYTEAATGITEKEIQSIPNGIALLTLELASRFVADAYEETYFAQSSHYENLYEQNKTKAINQLHFLNVYEKAREEHKL